MPPEMRELKELVKANLELTKENHKLLEKIHRLHVYSFWFKALWFAVIVGLPFVIFYFLLEPYVAALGITSEEFKVMVHNVSEFFSSPSWKVLQ